MESQQEKYNQIMDLDRADKLIREAAVTHQREGKEGLPSLIVIGYYGIFEIVARAQYSQWNKSFVYDGGIQCGGSDRNGGYTTIQQVLDASIEKATKWYADDDQTDK